MANFQTVPEQVQAVRFDPGTGSMTFDSGDTVAAGEWLIKHADGSLSKATADEFSALYVPVPEQTPPAAIVEPPAPPAEHFPGEPEQV